MAKDKLVTSGYCLILAANFLLYFAFYLILPVLPFYLTEVFHTGNAAVGVILSCYTIASLCIRPFSGYLLNTLAPQASLSGGILHLYHHFRRLHVSGSHIFIHHVAGCPRPLHLEW